MCRFNRITCKCDINAISQLSWVNLSDNVYLTTEDNNIRQRAHAGNSRDSCALFFVYPKCRNFLILKIYEWFPAFFWHTAFYVPGTATKFTEEGNAIYGLVLWYSTKYADTASTDGLFAYECTKMLSVKCSSRTLYSGTKISNQRASTNKC